MEPKISVPFSQQSAFGRYPKLDESRPQPPVLFLAYRF